MTQPDLLNSPSAPHQLPTISSFASHPLTSCKPCLGSDPVERFLSSYNSRCLLGEDPSHCTDLFHVPHARITPDYVASRLPIAAQYPHFAPQSAFCGGLGATLGAYDHVIPFSNLTAGLLVALRAARFSETAIKLAVKALNTLVKPKGAVQSFSTSPLVLSDEGRAAVESFYRDDYRLLSSFSPNRPSAHQHDGKGGSRKTISIAHRPAKPCIPLDVDDASNQTCRLQRCFTGNVLRCGLAEAACCTRCECQLCGICRDALEMLSDGY